MKNWISFPRVEGLASRQAHADLPPGTYEREMGKEGFFGPSTQLYHAHPPTGWTSWEGPLRPRAFDLTRINAIAASPWEADAVLSNAHLRFRQWRTEGKMDRLVRNGDGDELLFVHEGSLMSGDRKDAPYAAICRTFQGLGFGCAATNYRLAPAHKWPAQPDDVAAAVGWLKQNIRSFGGDPCQT